VSWPRLTVLSDNEAAPGLGSDMIDTIKNFAQTTDDPNVYTLAQIPPPADLSELRQGLTGDLPPAAVEDPRWFETLR